MDRSKFIPAALLAVVFVSTGCVQQARTRLTTPMGGYDSTRDASLGNLEARRTVTYAADGVTVASEVFELIIVDASGDASTVNQSLAEALAAQIGLGRELAGKIPAP